MLNPQDLLARNRRWAAEIKRHDSHFFQRLAKQQKPRFLWIGCSDSRVPANEIVDLTPGEVFVHRNVANLVVHTDLNLMSVLHFAVEQLHVEHVIVCGHYGCGGVRAAMTRKSFGLVVDKWLRKVKDVAQAHLPSLEAIRDPDLRLRRVVELNVVQQVTDLAHTSVIQQAWKDRGGPWLHGWAYDMASGKLQELTRLEPKDLPDDIYRFELE